MTAFYNEIDPFCAQWLRNLIDAGHIAPGVVDERSIEDIHPNELREFTQCHFFAGIGIWSYALRRAGWPDDRPVWTGSCPCQPFSAAGKGDGFDDERHLWPAWFHLISECRPGVVFGEQVASDDALDWLDLVQADLEGAHYASGAVDLCAAGVGAPHIRQRVLFVADADGQRLSRGTESDCGPSQCEQQASRRNHIGGCRWVGDTDGELEAPQSSILRWPHAATARDPWGDAEWIECRDGKSRPVEPGAFPLAHGAPARVGRLRAYGNGIVGEAAAAFIRAYISGRLSTELPA